MAEKAEKPGLGKLCQDQGAQGRPQGQTAEAHPRQGTERPAGGTSEVTTAEGLDSETAGTGDNHPRELLPTPPPTTEASLAVPSASCPEPARGSGPRRCKRVPAAAGVASVPFSSILTWNTHTLGGCKLLAVNTKISDVRPDIVVLTEAELQLWDTPTVQGYKTMVHSVSRSALVRTIMLTRKNLHAEQIDLSWATDIPVIAARIGDVAVIGLYRAFTLITKSGTIRGEPFEAEQISVIEQVVRSISERFKEVYLVGDFNLDILRLEDEEFYYRRQLLDRWMSFTNEMGLTLHKTGHTFKSYGLFNGKHKLSALDHVYTRSARAVDVSVLQDGTSDHKPVLAKIRCRKPKKPVRQTRSDKNWKALDASVLNSVLEEWDWSRLLCSTSADRATALLREAMVAATDAAVPTRNYTTPNINIRLKPETRAVMRARDAAKEEGKKSYKSLRNRALSLIRRDHVQRNLERIDKYGQEGAWQVVNEVTGKGRGHGLPLIGSSDEEAANSCNEYYISKVLKLRENMNGQPEPKGKTSAESSTGTFRFHNVGVATVRKALKKLKSKHSHGLDGIPITAYKSAFEPLALALVHLTNLVINTGAWPSEWKRSLVTPILKAGKPPGAIPSYRPVAGLSSVSKLVERILMDQMVAFLEEEGVIPHEQHGFRAGRSVDTALTSMLSRLAQAQEKGLKIGLAAYDYSAAFDTMSRNVLEEKLSAWAGEPAKKLLINYMTDRSQMVKWNSARSTELAVRYGVPQGSILAPLLFLLVTGDLPRTISSGVGPTVSAGVTLYADDTSGTIATRTWEDTEAAMMAMAEELEIYSRANELHLNLEKTQKLLIGQSSATHDTITILGVTIDKSAGFSTHHSEVLNDLRRRLGAVRRVACQIPRGKLLREIGNSLIVGRLQSSAWVTRPAHLNSQQGGHRNKGGAQVILNDFARLLLGISRADHCRVEDLLDKAQVPTVNQIVVRQAALSAWRATHGGALGEVLEHFDSRTRGSALCLRKPVSQRCTGADNMARSWNSSEALRSATTLHEARTIAKKMASEARHF